MRFCMGHSLFLHIQHKVGVYKPDLIQRRHNAIKLNLSSLQKITTHLECLHIELTTDFIDEYI